MPRICLKHIRWHLCVFFVLSDFVVVLNISHAFKFSFNMCAITCLLEILNEKIGRYSSFHVRSTGLLYYYNSYSIIKRSMSSTGEVTKKISGEIIQLGLRHSKLLSENSIEWFLGSTDSRSVCVCVSKSNSQTIYCNALHTYTHTNTQYRTHSNLKGCR